ncbi:LysR family transcriptional regulator [Ramlibacter sp. AW1]|uniref:LysR family transcriptional regulator n=1 Tax=Ramlibacter aurantiacus TaxID=2801330 RepID=A0A937D6H4_9BURK|nr:LysR family transcriptional regulator [Ramlibacter aurantiacus]MBL0420953.1 LysR family transcriptional regulator [Ramlibacter aurantiacus]
MNSDDLECFVRIVSSGSLSKAALELGADHSTLSRVIARLEGDTQVRLLHRSGRGVVPTEAGKALYELSMDVVTRMENARNAIRIYQCGGPRKLVIAAQPTIARISLIPLSLRLKEQFPNTQLKIIEGLGARILNLLASGEVDIALFYLPKNTAELKVDVLLHEHVSLIAPPAHTHIGDTFPVSGLGGVPLILPSTSYGLRVLAEGLAQQAGVSLNIVAECDGSTSLTKHMVQAGLGSTILPVAAVADELAQGKLRAARLVEPEVVRQIGIATSKNRAPIVGHWAMMRIFHEEITHIVKSGGWPGAVIA